MNDVVAAILILPSRCIKRTLQSKSRQRRTQQSKSRQSRTNRNASAGKRAYKLREAQGKIKHKKPTKRKSRNSKQVTPPLSLITSSLPSLDIAGEETLQRPQVQTRHAPTVS